MQTMVPEGNNPELCFIRFPFHGISTPPKSHSLHKNREITNPSGLTYAFPLFFHSLNLLSNSSCFLFASSSFFFVFSASSTAFLASSLAS